MSELLQPLMFYFGPWDRAGHFLHDEYGHSVRRDGRDSLPWNEWRGEVDGKLQPHERNCNGRSYCGCVQPEGAALLHHKAGWTALSFWDRSVDGRGGCNSTYFAKGEFTFEQMVEMAKTRFAYRWNKMNFEVTQAKQNLEAVACNEGEPTPVNVGSAVTHPGLDFQARPGHAAEGK